MNVESTPDGIPVLTLTQAEYNARRLAGYMAHYEDVRGIPPTMRECARAMGLANGSGAIGDRVRLAEQLGLVKYRGVRPACGDRGRARIRVWYAA